MAMLFELKQQREASFAKSEAIITAAESANRGFTESETADLNTTNAEVEALNSQIASIEKRNTLRAAAPKGQILPAADSKQPKVKGKVLTQDYATAFQEYILTGGRDVSAALYEGANAAGGYAVPITVDDQIVPLAPNELAVRRLSTVMSTTNDIRFPVKASFGSAGSKLESGATAYTFAGTSPSLGQFTLSAYMAGVTNDISWELAQDVPAFQTFAQVDMLIDQQVYEENLYVNGTGVGQAQGLLGNVGTGVTEEPDASSNLVSIDGTLDLIGSLKEFYLANAAFLMARPTSILIRKAQRQSNLFEPVWTRVGNQDYLHGYPVEYSSAMPVAARGATPLLFGDFKQGYIIGDRGGSGINVKVLDQPKALQGLLTLLTYRRTDGRVRRSEAIQPYNIAAS